MKSPDDDIRWARHVNGRWLVRESLRSDADAFLDHLAAVDPARFGRSCSRARRMMDHRQSDEDPKPWFYAGLFSLATREEAARYLKSHHFTVACIPAFDGFGIGVLRVEELRTDSVDKLFRVRQALAELGKGR
ncbi:MAG TPA: hypothetical protein PLA50_05735 [Bacteroidia bacterium]|nr:hypothetical protein [Bacteroidia bacterium]